MNRLIKGKKELYLMLFFVFMACLFVGYAYLEAKLKVNGTTEIGQNGWEIHFDNVVENGCNNVEVQNHAVILNNNNHKISFDVEFKKADDRFDFVVDLVNGGTIDAMIGSFQINGIPETDNNLSYSITYLDNQPVSNCDPLYAGKTRKVMISFVLLNSEEYEFKEATSYHLSLNFDFVQLDSKVCEINDYIENDTFNEDEYKDSTSCSPEVKYSLYIDPTRGLYRGSKHITVVNGLSEGDVIDLGEPPVKEGYTFIGWEAESNYNNVVYETNYNEAGNNVTIGTNNAYIKAVYEMDDSRRIARIKDVYYPTIQAAFDDSVPGDTIYLLDNTAEDPINELKEERPFTQKTVKFDLGGFTVTGQLVNEDVLTLINGTFINPNGIAVINKGTLELGLDGEDNDTEDENDSYYEEGIKTDGVSLIGSNEVGGLGLDQRGKFNFYDGYIQGYIGIAGTINKTPAGYYVFVEHGNDEETNEEYQKAYLVLQPNRAVVKTIGDGESVFYFNLQDAMNVATSLGYNIEAVRDFPASYEVVVPSGKTVNFDLVGNNIELGTDFINNGSLIISDSGKDGLGTKGSIKLTKTIQNNGELKLENLVLSLTTNLDMFNNKGNLTVSKSRLTTLNGYVFKIEDGSLLEMDQDTYLDANSYAVYVDVEGDKAFTISGGNINGIYNRGNLIIDENTNVTQKDSAYRAIYHNSSSRQSGTITVDGGNVFSNNDEGGTLIYCENSGTKNVVIEKGNLNVSSNTERKDAIAIGGYCNVTMNDGIINSTVNTENSTAYAFSGSNAVTVNGGTVTTKASKGTSTISNGGSINLVNGTFDIDGKNANAFVGTTAIVDGGTIVVDGTTSAVIFNNGTIATVNDGVLSSNYDCFQMSGNKTINGGTLTCGRYGVTNSGNTGTFTMNGGELTAVEEGVRFYDNIGYVTYYNAFVMTGGRLISSTSNGVYVNGDSHYSVNIKASDSVIEESEDNSTELYPYIEGYKSGVYVVEGSVNIDTVNIVGKTEYGLYVDVDTNIGNNDGNISVTLPMIKGDTYGVYVNSGKINIYDGIFKGQVDGYTGLINGLADGAVMVDSTEIIDDVLFNTDYLQAQDDFLKIIRIEDGVEKEYFYNSLQIAVDSIEESDTIYVIKDHDIKSETIIPAEKNVVLDYSGFTLDNTKYIINNGTFTTKNTVDDQSVGGMNFEVDNAITNNGTLTIDGGNYTNNGNIFINNGGEVNISGGKIDLNYDSSNSIYGIYNKTDRGKTLNVNMTGGELDITGKGSIYGIYNIDQGSTNVVINGGTIKITSSTGYNAVVIQDSSYYGKVTAELINATVDINIKSTGTACVIGGDVTTIIHDGTYTIINPNGTATISSEANTNIKSGTYATTATNAYISGYHDTMTIDGGTFTTSGTTNSDLLSGGSYATVVNDGIFTANKKCMTIDAGNKTINGGTFTCGTIGLSDTTSNRTFTMTGGTITSKNNTLDFSSTSGTHTINIYGGTLTSTKGNALYSNSANNVMNIDASDQNVEDGEYPIFKGYTYGIYVNAGKGVVNKAIVFGDTKNGLYVDGDISVGIDDGVVNTEYPMIKGKKYGLFINGGTVNVYDGIFKGINDGYNGYVSGFTDGYTFISDTEDIDGVEYMVSYLGQLGDFLKVGDETFNSLQTAIDYIDATGTIEVIASHDIKTESTIPIGKNITLDVHGFTLNDTKSIINDGTLLLTDLSDDGNGGITNSNTEAFVNNGSITVQNGHYYSTGNTLYTNTGNLIINGGELRITSSGTTNTQIIYNKIGDDDRTVNVTINGGTLYAQGKGNCFAIYNDRYSMGQMLLNDGTITVNGTGTSVSNVNIVYSVLGNNSSVLNTVKITNGTYNLMSLTTYDGYSNGASISYGTHMNILDGNFSVTAKSGRGSIAQAGVINITTGKYDIEAKTAVSFDYYSTVNIIDGEFTNTGTNGATILSGYTYTSVINNGTFISTHQCADMYSGSLTINGGMFTCGTYGVGSTNGRSILTYNGGTLNTIGNGINITDGSANIYGGAIISAHGYGVYSKNSGNSILINTSDENVASNNNVYIEGGNSGVYIDNGKIILGKEDGNSIANLFTIKGGEYGVYFINGTFTYFDGTLKGMSRGYLGTITTIESGNYIYQEYETVGEDEWTINYLKSESDIILNLNSGVKYNNLVTAFDASDSGDTLQLLDNFQLYYVVQIGDTVDVTLDLAGYNFTMSQTLKNNGKVKIINSSDTNNSIISSGLNINMLINNGILDIDNVRIQNIKSNIRPVVTNSGGVTTLRNVIIDSVNCIYTYAGGETNLYNSTLNSSDTAVYDAGKTYATETTINGTNYGIYSYTNTNGIYDNLTITANGSSYYKYGGNSTQTLTNVIFSDGYLYSSGGSSNFSDGTINQYIVNNSNMKLENMTISDYEELNYYGNYTSINNSSTLIMDNNTYDFGISRSGTYAYSDTARFNSSHIYAINNSGTININDNTINITKSVNHWPYECRYDTDEECPYQMYFYAIYNTGTLNMSGNEIAVNDVSSQRIGDLNDNYYGITNVNNGVSISDGDKITMSGGLRSYALYDSTSKTTSVVRNVDYKVSNVKYGYGLYKQNGLYTIESGSIDVSGTNVYGAYINNGKLTMGIFDGSGNNDGNVQFNNPLIKAVGTESGIGVKYYDGEFYHYDGKIIGNTYAKPDITNLAETGYESTIYYDSDNNLEYCVLEFLENNQDDNENMTVVMNNVYYKSIEDAISRAKDGDIIKLLVQIEGNVVNDANSDVGIILDLNKHTISGTLTNNGKLTLINGQITSPNVNAVVNNGLLYIGVNDSNIVYDYIVIRGISVGIQNNGKVYMYDGNIIGDRAFEGNKILTAYNHQVNEQILDGFDNIYISLRESVSITEGTKYNYEYTGDEGILEITESGYYRLETWGAQGGDVDLNTIGGYGAYASGVVYLNAGDTLYINVGGKGATASTGSGKRAIGGYNGGGYAYQNVSDVSAAGGGGATHIAISTGLLSTISDKSDVLIVAAGGSGAFTGNGYNLNGNSGGGYLGGNSIGSVEASTQTSGFAFGQGDDNKYNNRTNSTHVGGGSGYYGGVAGEAEKSASGGSSYIGNDSLISVGLEYKCMYGYNIEESIAEDEYSISVNDYSAEPSTKKPKAGDGYARITRLSIN